MPESDLAEPPDGGWGWVIVAAVFFITLNSFGTMYSISVTFDSLIAEFGCSKSEVSAIASIALCLQCFLGPVVSVLQQKVQPRIVVVIGAVITGIALIASAFAPNVFCLYFTFGTLGGIGIAMVYLPVIILISFYFDRRRSLATALGGIGAYVGCFVHPYLIRFLISLYDWRGALLILGAVEFNSVAAAMLLRPLVKSKKQFLEAVVDAEEGIHEATAEPTLPALPAPPNEDPGLQPNSESSKALDAFISENIAGCNRLGSVSEAEEVEARSPVDFCISDSKLGFQDLFDTGGETTEPSSPMPTVPFFPHRQQSTDSGEPISSRQPKKRPAYTNRQFSERNDRTVQIRGRRISAPIYQKQLSAGAGGAAERQFAALSNAEPLLEQTFPTANQRPINRHLSKISCVSSISAIYSPSVISLTQLATSNRTLKRNDRSRTNTGAGSEKGGEEASISVAASNQQQASTPATPAPDADLTTDKKKEHDRVCHILAPFVSHFRNPKFTAFFVSNFLKGIIYYTPSMFIVGWGKELGIASEKTTFILSLVGIGNIIGRPVMAFSGDLFANYRLPLLGLMVAINSVVTLLTPLLANFYFLAFFVFQFAFLVGGGQTLLTPILSDMVPLSELAFAFGLLIAAEGAAILVGPPLLGLLPTYEAIFSTAGFFMMSSAALLFVAAYAEKIWSWLSAKFRLTKGQPPSV